MKCYYLFYGQSLYSKSLNRDTKLNLFLLIFNWTIERCQSHSEIFSYAFLKTNCMQLHYSCLSFYLKFKSRVPYRVSCIYLKHGRVLPRKNFFSTPLRDYDRKFCTESYCCLMKMKENFLTSFWDQLELLLALVLMKHAKLLSRFSY